MYLAQLPDLPPVFETTSIAPMTIVRSMAFSMSNNVSPATATAVSASISTPVPAFVRTSDSILNPGSESSISIRAWMCVSGSGWQNGIKSAVRLAAMTPASSAVAMTPPFGAVPARTCSSVSGSQAS